MTSFNPPPSPPVAIPVVTYAAVRRPPFPSVGQAVLLTLILIGAQLVCGGVLGVLTALSGLGPETAFGPGPISLGNLISFAIVLIVCMAWGKLSLRDALPCRAVPLSLWPAAAVTVIGLSVILSEFSNLLMWVLPLPDFILEFFGGIIGNEGQVWQGILLICIVAPLTEEPIFRGLMLSGLLRCCRPWAAISLTAVLFAVTHLNPWQFVPALSLGLLFGWWFHKTRSLLPGIFGHALNNSLPFIAAVLAVVDPRFEIPGYTTGTPDAVVLQPPWFDAAGLVLIAIGLAWCRRVLQRMPAPPISQQSDAPPAIPIAMPVTPEMTQQARPFETPPSN